MKKFIAIAMIAALPMTANSTETEDVVIAASAATVATATIASVAAPAAILHSSGAMIMYSGAGYVAGTIGVAAGTVAALPVIAVGAAAVGTGAVIYKYSDDIAKTDTFQAAKSYGQSVLTYYGW